MKAKRRQELKTNDLAQALDDLGAWFRQRGVYVAGIVGAVVVVAVVVSYMNSAKADAIDRAYAELRGASDLAPSGLPKDAEEIERAFAKIDELVARTTDESFRLDALISQGRMALRLVEASEGGIQPQHLPAARRAYEEIVAKYQDRTLHYGRALYGLFQVEAGEFAVDGEPRHREAAAQHLRKLRDDARFNGMPYQTLAVDLLNDLDSVFTAVTFASAPVATPAPAPAAAAEAPAVSPGDDKESVVTAVEEDAASSEVIPADDEQVADADAEDMETEAAPTEAEVPADAPTEGGSVEATPAP